LRELASLKIGLEVTKDGSSVVKVFERIQIENRSRQNRVYKIMFTVANHEYFVGFISFIIVLNTALLALDSYPVN
jgi:hypothetical protein